MCWKYVHNTYKWWPKYCKWMTTTVCIHFCQNYLIELTIKRNPLLPLSRISDNSKFCNGPVNFEISRFTYIYREWMWSRALDEWCCSVSMVWVQIPSREEQNIWQLKNLILTLFGLIFRRIHILLVFIFIIYHIYVYYYNKYILLYNSVYICKATVCVYKKDKRK